jgi:hypothetical protein
MQTVQGQHLVECVHRLVRNARNAIALVSPFFDPWQELGDFVEAALRRGVRVMLVIRDGHADSLDAAAHFRRHGAIVQAVPSLHFKLYVNETHAISTSMNLLVSSANTAVELGHVFDATVDRAHYQQVLEQVERLAPTLRLTHFLSGRGTSRSASHRGSTSLDRASYAAGYCIRCGDGIQFDLAEPLCDQHLRTWMRFQNVDYPEAFCHRCGSPADTSVAKPCCFPCWKNASRAR